jgi:hypothetical protein
MKTKNLLLFSLVLGLGLAAGAVLVLSHTPTARAAGPWYVSPSGDDSDCLSWDHACTTINGALGKAGSGDTIYVGAGTYTESLSLSNITLTLTGAGADATFIDGGGTTRVVEVLPTSVVTISGVTIRNGRDASGDGGGIYCGEAILMLEDAIVRNNSVGSTHDGGGLYAEDSTVTLSATQVLSNAAYDGGGIAVRDGALSLAHSTVASNTAGQSGGGIWSWASTTTLSYSMLFNNTADYGGGFYQVGAGATLAVESSLVAENVAESEGGGLGIMENGGWATIENSTISGNRASTYGGGIETRIPTTITHTTVVSNVADADGDNSGDGGGLFAYSGGAQVYVGHTIIAGNVNRGDATYDDCYRMSSGSVTSLDYNLVGTVGNCAFGAGGDITGQDPLLGPLQDNGGDTLTHALPEGSPAVNAGDPAFAPPPAYDQRGPGFWRVGDGRIDIGAYERQTHVYLPLVLRDN